MQPATIAVAAVTAIARDRRSHSRRWMQAGRIFAFFSTGIVAVPGVNSVFVEASNTMQRRLHDTLFAWNYAPAREIDALGISRVGVECDSGAWRLPGGPGLSAMRGSRTGNGKRALQVVVAICSIVPLAAGAAGVILGPALIADSAVDGPDLDGHFRYLSGLLFGLGLAYALSVPRIELHKHRFLLLGGIVILGGFGRLLSLLLRGTPSPVMIGALAMELVVTPILTLWQLRISRDQEPS